MASREQPQKLKRLVHRRIHQTALPSNSGLLSPADSESRLSSSKRLSEPHESDEACGIAMSTSPSLHEMVANGCNASNCQAMPNRMQAAIVPPQDLNAKRNIWTRHPQLIPTSSHVSIEAGGCCLKKMDLP